MSSRLQVELAAPSARDRPSSIRRTAGEGVRGRLDVAVRGPGERGQAAVELVGVLPFVVLAALVAWQLVLAGHTAWLAGHAARVAARADAVGRSVEAGARSALPRSHEAGLRVRRLPEGGVRVSVPVPLLLPGWRGPVRVTAESSLGRSK